MAAPRLSAADKQAILAQYQDGVPTAAIAAKFGVDPSYPTLLAKRRGIDLRLAAEARAAMAASAERRT